MQRIVNSKSENLISHLAKASPEQRAQAIANLFSRLDVGGMFTVHTVHPLALKGPNYSKNLLSQAEVSRKLMDKLNYSKNMICEWGFVSENFHYPVIPIGSWENVVKLFEQCNHIAVQKEIKTILETPITEHVSDKKQETAEAKKEKSSRFVRALKDLSFKQRGKVFEQLFTAFELGQFVVSDSKPLTLKGERCPVTHYIENDILHKMWSHEKYSAYPSRKKILLNDKILKNVHGIVLTWDEPPFSELETIGDDKYRMGFPVVKIHNWMIVAMYFEDVAYHNLNIAAPNDAYLNLAQQNHISANIKVIVDKICLSSTSSMVMLLKSLEPTERSKILAELQPIKIDVSTQTEPEVKAEVIPQEDVVRKLTF